MYAKFKVLQLSTHGVVLFSEMATDVLDVKRILK